MACLHIHIKKIAFALLFGTLGVLIGLFAAQYQSQPNSEEVSHVHSRDEQSHTLDAKSRLQPALESAGTSIKHTATIHPKEALRSAKDNNVHLTDEQLAPIVAEWIANDPFGAHAALQSENNFLDERIRLFILIELIPHLYRETPEELTTLINSLIDPYKPGRLYDHVIQAWVCFQPEEALKYATGQSDYRRRRRATKSAIKAWMEGDPIAANQWVMQLDQRRLKDEILSGYEYYPISADLLILAFEETQFSHELADALANRLWQRDLPKLMDLLAQVPKQEYSNIRHALSSIPVHDAQAFQTIHLAIRGTHLEQSLNSIFSNWGKRDPEGAWAWLQTQPGEANYDALLSVHLSQRLESAPESFNDLIPLMPDEDVQIDAVNRAFRNIIEMHPNPIQWARENLDPDIRGKVLLQNFKHMVRYHPTLAFEGWNEVAESGRKDTLLKTHIESFIEESPESTLDIIFALPAGRLRSDYLKQALNDWAKIAPAAAYDYVNQADWVDDTTLASVYLTAAKNLATNSPRDAIKMVRSLPESSGRNPQLNDLLEDLAIRGHHSLVRNAIDQMPLGSVKDQALLSVLDAFAFVDPRQAYQWIQSTKDEAFRRQALPKVANRWLKVNPVEASRWVATLPPGKGRDSTVQILVAHQLRDASFQSAFRWALSIQDERMRRSSTEHAIKGWQKVDQDSPLQAVRVADRLSQDEKDQLIVKYEKK